METLGIFAIIYIISGIIGVAFAIRFWMTMTRIKQIRDFLLKQDQATKPAPKYETEKPGTIDQDQLEFLESKLKANQCVVQVKKTQRLEIWNKTDWDDVVKAGREDMFVLLSKNF